MKLSNLIIAILIWPFLSNGQTSCPGNLLTNPGFENSLTDWSITGTVSITTNLPNSGAKAARICNAIGSVGQAKPATVGQSYTAKLWIKTAGATVSLRFLNASWAPISTNSVVQQVSYLSWTEVTLNATAPTGAAYVHVVVTEENPNSCLDLDDVCLFPGTAPCTMSASISSMPCNDNGTPSNPADDYFSLHATVVGTNTGIGWNAQVNGTTNNYSYGSNIFIGNFNINQGPFSLTLYDFNPNSSNNPGCYATLNVTPPSPCSSSTLPDLSFGNVTPSGATVEQNRLLNTSFTLKNVGSPVSSTTLYTSIYLSNDPILNTPDDVLLNAVRIPGTITDSATFQANVVIPESSSIGTGAKYLIYQVNTANTVNESNYANNVLVKNINIINFTGYVCPKLVGNGQLDCVENLPNNQLKVVINDNNYLTSYTLNDQGNILTTTASGNAVPFTWTIENNNIVKKNAAGAIIYTKPIPASLVSQYNVFVKAIESGTGLIIAAYKFPDNSNSLTDRVLTIIKTDINVNLISSVTFPALGSSEVQALEQITSTRIALLNTELTSTNGGKKATLRILDNSLVLKSAKVVSNTSQLGIYNSRFRKTSCGTYFFNTLFGASSSGGGGGSNINSVAGYYQLVADSMQLMKSFSDFFNSSYAGSSGSASTKKTFSGPAPGGGILQTVDSSFYTNVGINYLNSTYPGNDTLFLKKIVNNSVVWSKNKLPYLQYPHSEMVQIGANYFLLHTTSNNKVNITNVDCDNNAPAPNGLPDINISNIVLPSTGFRASTYNYSYNNNNGGPGTVTVPSGSFSYLYLSLDNIQGNSDDIFLDAFFPQAAFYFNPGTSFTVSGTFTIPLSVPAGNYFMFVQTDVVNTIAESNENNNFSPMIPFSVTNSLLQGTDLIIPANGVSANLVVNAGTRYLGYSITATNIGNTLIPFPGLVTVAFYISTDTVLSSNDYLATTSTLSNINPTTYYNSTDLVAINSAPAGYNFLIVKVDYVGFYNETNENNNTVYQPIVVPSLLTGVDFVATPASIQSFGINVIPGPVPQRVYGFTFVGNNIGTPVPVTPPVTVTFYLSADNNFDGNDLLLGNHTLSNSGNVYANQADIQPVPLNIPAGLYYLIAIIDGTYLYPENNESNNIAVKASQITVPALPGQALTDLNMFEVIAPLSGTAGTLLPVTYTIKTLSATGAGPSTTGIYLSMDNVLNTNDISLLTRLENPLIGNSSITVSSNLTLPANTISGNYFLIFKTDINNTVAEANENNNVKSVQISIAGNSGYCNSQGNTPWQDWIGKVELTNLINPSGKTSYSNFTNMTANVVKGASHPIKLTAAYSWETYNEYWKVWIDYNHNNVFDEPAEIAYQGVLPKPANGTPSSTLNVSINIPASALTGATRMRVSMKRLSLATPCESFPYGEVEDYTVNIQPTIQAMMAASDIPVQAGIYPNPAEYNAIVNLKDYFELPLKLSIVDMQGTVVLKKEFTRVESDEDIIQVADFPEGIYWVYFECPVFRPVVRKLMVIK